jgi:DNA-binding Lrp family transcriptional regulator
MKKKGIIKMFHTFVDHHKIGYPIYIYVNVELHNFTEKDEQKLLSYLLQDSHVSHIAKMTGRWDMLIAIVAKDLEHFDDVLRNIRREFSSIIKDYSTSTIIKEYKFDNFSDLVGK